MNLKTFLIISILLAGCASMGPSAETITVSLPSTTLSTASPTETPMPTPSPTATSAPNLPLAWSASLPDLDQTINRENLKDLVEVAQWKGSLTGINTGGKNVITRTTIDRKLIFVLDNLGLDIFRTQDKVRIYHLDLLADGLADVNGFMDLQISDNGEWALAGGEQLVHFVPGEVPAGRTVNEPSFYSEPPGWLAADGSIFVNYDSIMDLETGETIYTWDKSYRGMHGYNPVTSADGKLLAARVDFKINIWNISDGSLVKSVSIQNQNTSRTWNFSLGGTYFALLDGDKLQIWDLGSGEQLQSISTSCTVGMPIFSPDGKLVTIAENFHPPFSPGCTVTVWRVQDGTEIGNSPFGPDGRQVLIDNNGTIEFVKNTQSIAPWANLGLASFVSNELLYAPPCTITSFREATCIPNSFFGSDNVRISLAQGIDGQLYTVKKGLNTTQIYKEIGDEGGLVYSFPAAYEYLELSGIDSESKLLFANIGHSFNHNEAVGFNYESGLKLFSYDQLSIHNVAYSYDKKYVAVCVADNNSGTLDKLILIDVVNNLPIVKEPIRCPFGAGMAYSHDNTRLLIASTEFDSSGLLLVTNLITITLSDHPRITEQPYDCRVISLAFSPDDDFLAIGCSYFKDDKQTSDLQFRSVDEMQELYRLPTGIPVYAIDFSPDGKKMVTGTSYQGLLSIWGVDPELKAIAQEELLFDPLRRVALDPSPIAALKPSFVYPINGQVLGFGGGGYWLFQVTAVEGAKGYLWSFYQDGNLVWQNQRDEGMLGGVDYAIEDVEGSTAHAHFHPGFVEVKVQAQVNGEWTPAATILIYVSPDA